MIKFVLVSFVSILSYSYPLNAAVAATLLAQNGYCASSASNVVTVTGVDNGRGWTSPPVWYAIEWIYSDNIIHVDIMNKNTDQESYTLVQIGSVSFPGMTQVAVNTLPNGGQDHTSPCKQP